RCATRIGRRAAIVPGPPCVPAQLGVAACPCRGQVDEAAYADHVGAVRRALTNEPGVALQPLEARMDRLAEEERFEEAAATRDRLAALARALQRRRTIAMWRGVRCLVVECDGQRIEIRRGLVRWADEELEHQPAAGPPPKTRREESSEESSRRRSNESSDESPTRKWVAGGDIAEILLVDRWLSRNAARVRVHVVDGELMSALPRIVAGANPRSR
ncbi:MAG: polymerase subunit epsilon, partial [Actinomycetota bacterium]|nr:polymerase subunit epsilon [Actinomycetota bacterium]